MKRMAIFVEGQTEQIFVEKLLKEIVGDKGLIIELVKKVSQFSEMRINSHSEISNQKYYILIRDCSGGGGDCVKSDLIESYPSLKNKGYNKVLGLRDVYPHVAYDDIPKLIKGLTYGIPEGYEFIIILSIMEIEAWFLAEINHFSKIHPSITIESIKNLLCFDPVIDDVEKREHPSEDLNRIYKLAGRNYSKKRSVVQRTVDKLDYVFIYFTLKAKVNSLGKFIEQIDSFLDDCPSV